jgi:hypothetical protein
MMPARLAFPFIYRTLTEHVTEESKDAIDELLGDPAAAVRIAERRMGAVKTSGFEVG